MLLQQNGSSSGLNKRYLPTASIPSPWGVQSTCRRNTVTVHCLVVVQKRKMLTMVPSAVPLPNPPSCCHGGLNESCLGYWENVSECLHVHMPTWCISQISIWAHPVFYEPCNKLNHWTQWQKGVFIGSPSWEKPPVYLLYFSTWFIRLIFYNQSKYLWSVVFSHVKPLPMSQVRSWNLEVRRSAELCSDLICFQLRRHGALNILCPMAKDTCWFYF